MGVLLYWLVLGRVSLPADDICRHIFMSLRVMSTVQDLGVLQASSLFPGFDRESGFSLAWRRRRKRVDLDIWSWSMIFFKGTFALQSSTATLLVPEEKWAPFASIAYRQLPSSLLFFLQESQPDGEFLSQSSEISAAPPHWQATHTVWCSGWCNFQGGCNFNI